MKFFTQEVKVRAFMSTQYSERDYRGSGYCKEQQMYQQKVRITRFLGIPIWTTILDSEEVPSFAWIQAGAFGETEWRSRILRELKEEKAPLKIQT